MSKKAPTLEESKRMDRVAQMGCIACRQQFGAYVPAEIQHLTSGGRRLGHMFTIPLCEWHHRGVTRNGLTTEYMTQTYGPSFANSRREFEAYFGPEEKLLKDTNLWLGNSVQSKDSSQKQNETSVQGAYSGLPALMDEDTDTFG